MNKIIRYTLLIVSGLLSACATNQPVFEPFTPQSLNEEVRSGRLVQKTDNLFVVLDASSSMGDSFDHPGYPAQPEATKFDVEKEILSRMNQTIPNIKFSSAIRSFGFGSCLDWDRTKLVQPLQAHSTEAFQSNLDSIPCAGGGTPMTSALDAAINDLMPASGRIALLVLSDGHDASFKSPAETIQRLKNRYGDHLCVYSVWVGNNENDEGHALMKSLPDISECGLAVDAASIASANDLAGFVQQVFFNKAAPKIDVCALDDDGDGVGNCQDKCADTPKGADVDASGCWAYHGVLFDFDKATIKPEFEKMLHNAVNVMKLNPRLTVSIEGHTDSIGSEKYNQSLSEKRAHAVMEFLINHGVATSRLKSHGYGESHPVDTNKTPEGRYNNRRVEFKRTDK
ncbi:MAG: OmpA family protein [Gammaproteobacteria bacterium]